MITTIISTNSNNKKNHLKVIFFLRRMSGCFEYINLAALAPFLLALFCAFSL